MELKEDFVVSMLDESVEPFDSLLRLGSMEEVPESPNYARDSVFPVEEPRSAKGANEQQREKRVVFDEIPSWKACRFFFIGLAIATGFIALALFIVFVLPKWLPEPLS